jgi:hypothetical protein
MERALELLVSLSTALFVAMILATIARDEVGMSAAAIRTDALSAAGLLFVTVGAASVLKRKRKR